MDSGKKPHITDRDKEIFLRLLQAKNLTCKELVDAHFGGSKAGYKRLALLCSAGYLDNKGRAYSLKQKGLDALQERAFSGVRVSHQLTDADIGFRLHLNSLFLEFPGAKGAAEAKKELLLNHFVPLYAVVGDLHIFRVKSSFQPRTLDTILNAADKLPRSIVICATEHARAALRKRYHFGRVCAILEDEFSLIPQLVTDPLYHLRLLFNAANREDSRIMQPDPAGLLGHWAEVTISHGTILMAETVTGCLSTYRKIKNFDGDFYFILAKDKKSIRGLPFKNRPVNVFLPDGTMFGLEDIKPETGEAVCNPI